MSSLVDKDGKEMNTKEEAEQALPKEGVENGAGIGDKTATESKEDVPAKPLVAEFEITQTHFVVKIPVLNNLYEVLGKLLWAEDRIRTIYAEAQMRKAQSKLSKPTGFLKTFKNKWGR